MASSRTLALLLLFSLSAPGAFAQSQDFDICAKQSGENAIAACSDAIASGKFTGDRLAELYNSRGAEWRLRQNYERAIADYDEALLLAPHYVAALNNRCWALAAVGRAKEGLDDCNVSLRVKPNNDLTYHNRALANLRLGNFDDALADCEIALKANPNRAQALYIRGVIKLRKGDATGGNTDIEAARKIRAAVEQEFQKIGVLR
jgi:tetratricopeptide (TPR) repeat protein